MTLSLAVRAAAVVVPEIRRFCFVSQSFSVKTFRCPCLHQVLCCQKVRWKRKTVPDRPEAVIISLLNLGAKPQKELLQAVQIRSPCWCAESQRQRKDL